MKTLLLSYISLALLACSSLKQDFNLEKAPQLIEAIVPVSVEIGVKKHPNTIPYLEALSTTIKSFALGDDLSPVQLEKAIKALKIKELTSPEALAVANSVVALYKAYYESAVIRDIADVKNLTPILKALSDSIDQGLNK